MWDLSTFSTLGHSKPMFWDLKSTKKPDKWKKHSVSIIVLATFFGRNLSLSDFSFSQVTSVEKRESQQHFSASAYGLGLKKLFLGFLFSTSVTWEKLKSDVEKFYFRRAMEKNQNKILLFEFSTISYKSYLICILDDSQSTNFRFTLLETTFPVDSRRQNEGIGMFQLR